MSSNPTKQIDGDVAVGRNVSVGGNATVRGSATIGHNLKVEGWLDAKNIKGPNKGLFATPEKLREAYPRPHDGWIALVGTTLPAPVYTGDGGNWVATGDVGGNPTIDNADYEERLDDTETKLKNLEDNFEKIRPIKVSSEEELDRMLEAGECEAGRIYYTEEES